MKVTFVLPGFPIKPTGGFKIVYSYADFLAENGYDVSIIHMYMLPAEKRFQDKFGKLKFLLSFFKMFIRMIQVKIFRSKLWDISWFGFKNDVKFKFNWFPVETGIPTADIIFATAFETADFVFQLNKTKGRKFYFIQHFESWAADDKEVIRSWKLPMTKIVIASWLKEIADSIGVDCWLIPNFIDKDEFYLTDNIESVKRDSIVMLYHFLKVKGSQDGISALKKVKLHNPKTNIILFGTIDRPSDLPDDFFYFKSPKKSFLREKIYNRASIYLMPSHKEGWGLTATEAMACGAALVSTDNGGVNDFAINKKTAIITPVGDSGAMASSIQFLLDDNKFRTNMASNGQKKVSEFSIENSGKKLIKVLEYK